MERLTKTIVRNTYIDVVKARDNGELEGKHIFVAKDAKGLSGAIVADSDVLEEVDFDTVYKNIVKAGVNVALHLYKKHVDVNKYVHVDIEKDEDDRIQKAVVYLPAVLFTRKTKMNNYLAAIEVKDSEDIKELAGHDKWGKYIVKFEIPGLDSDQIVEDLETRSGTSKNKVSATVDYILEKIKEIKEENNENFKNMKFPKIDNFDTEDDSDIDDIDL